MSLFDVIKYPISNPPTELELSRIPKKVYQDWVYFDMRFHHIDTVYMANFLNNDLSVYYKENFLDRWVSDLRNRIKEMP